MKYISSNSTAGKSNSKYCQILEYPLDDKNIDLAVATIAARYPEKGYCFNLVSKELIYVLEGSGTIYCENGSIDFSVGDSILIDKAEKYYWKTEYCKVTVTCTPAWSKKQYRLVD